MATGIGQVGSGASAPATVPAVRAAAVPTCQRTRALRSARSACERASSSSGNAGIRATVRGCNGTTRRGCRPAAAAGEAAHGRVPGPGPLLALVTGASGPGGPRCRRRAATLRPTRPASGAPVHPRLGDASRGGARRRRGHGPGRACRGGRERPGPAARACPRRAARARRPLPRRRAGRRRAEALPRGRGGSRHRSVETPSSGPAGSSAGGSSGGGSSTVTWSRPACLLRYIASSARAMRVPRSSSVWAIAPPTETWAVTLPRRPGSRSSGRGRGRALRPRGDRRRRPPGRSR